MPPPRQPPSMTEITGILDSRRAVDNSANFSSPSLISAVPNAPSSRFIPRQKFLDCPDLRNTSTREFERNASSSLSIKAADRNSGTAIFS